MITNEDLIKIIVQNLMWFKFFVKAGTIWVLWGNVFGDYFIMEGFDGRNFYKDGKLVFLIKIPLKKCKFMEISMTNLNRVVCVITDV